MNYKMMGRFIGQITALEAVFMLPAMLISLCSGEQEALFGFLVTLGALVVVSLVLLLTCRSAGVLFGAKEGLVCVGLSWVTLSLLGCLPFYLSREIPRFIDAFFETVSGFSTFSSAFSGDSEFRVTRTSAIWLMKSSSRSPFIT